MVALSNPFSKNKGEEENQGKEAEAEMAEELKEEGADVQTFSEDASPEEKSKAAAKAREGLKPKGELAEKQEQEKKAEEEKLQRAVESDLGGRKVRPNVNMRDVDRASRSLGQLGYGDLVPGALPAGQPSLNIPDWYTVGWIHASRSLRDMKPGELEVSEERMRDTSLVNSFLSDAYYGYMWSDGAVIVASIVLTYFVTRFGGGWGTLFIILSAAGTFYCASYRRTRQRMRDDVQRELARQRMMNENETARWINNFLSRFWLIYEPVLSATIVQSVDEVLKQQCPPFLDSLRLTTFTLGTKAPIIESVRTLPDTPDDTIVMDWKLSFTPNDVNDLTVYQASKKINPKVVLTIRVGKGMVGAGLPVLLQNMSFVGLLRVRLKLISSFPHIQMVDLSFMESPFIDFELKPIGGNTFGLDVSALPGLSGFIHNQIDANLGPMMYNPNQFSLNLEELMSGTPLDSTIGVLQVTIWSARDLVGVKFAGGTPDPYVTLALNDGKELARTNVKHSTIQPTYKETKFLLLKDLQGLLTLTLFDYNGNRPDTRLGVTNVDLSTLAENPEPGQLNKAVMYNEKQHGSVQFSMSYYPVLKPETAEDGTPLPLPETNAGIVRLTLHQVKNLMPLPELEGEMEPKARLLLNNRVIKETPVIKHTRDPIFEDVTEFLVTDRASSVLTVDVVDARDAAKDGSIASVSTSIEDLIQSKKRQQDWFPVPKSPDTLMRMSSMWKPVVMAGSINGSNSYRPSIGALKVWLRGAFDVKNVEALMGGKSDPYAMLRVNNLVVSGTAVVENNLSPVWNQVLYAPVHSTSEIVRLEVMDYQNSTADRTLGYIDLPVERFAQDNMDNARVPYSGNGRHTLREKLRQSNGAHKGLVDFDVEFLPAMRVAGANFIEQNKKMEAEQKQKKKDVPQLPPGSALDTPDAVRQQQNEDEEEGTDQIVAGQAVQDDDEDDEEQGVQISPEQLMHYPSGVLAFNMISGTILKPRAQLEVVFDDNYWPAYMTERRKKNYNWDEVGEAVIRELDVSCVWFRLRNGAADEDVFAEYMCNTRELLEKCLTEPTELTLTPTGSHAMDLPELDLPDINLPDAQKMGAMPGKAFKGASDFAKGGVKGGVDAAKGGVKGGMDLASSGGKSLSNFAGQGFGGMPTANTIKISCRYIPLDVNLEPVESIVNQGALSIEVVSAHNLRSADRGGRSDPYVIFQDNGMEMARTKVVKRTLNPTWNQVLPDVVIKSRLTHDYVFNVRDWDQVSASDPLGVAHVNLAELEPFETHERTYPLGGEGANPDSFITVRMQFTPQYANNRTSKGSAFIGRNVASGVIGGIGGIGKGFASGGAHIGRGFFNVLTGGHHESSHKKSASNASQLNASEAQQPQKKTEPSSETNPDEAASVRDSQSLYGQQRPESAQEGSVRHRRSRLHNPFKRR